MITVVVANDFGRATVLNGDQSVDMIVSLHSSIHSHWRFIKDIKVEYISIRRGKT